MGEKVVKRGRGRPRKNPLPVNEPVKAKRKRGRPKKIKDQDLLDNQVEPLVPLKVGKAVGFCPHCFKALCTLDNMQPINPDDKRTDVYFCYGCRKEIKESKLLEEKPVENTKKYRTKKEYLEDCLQISDDSKGYSKTPLPVQHDNSRGISNVVVGEE